MVGQRLESHIWEQFDHALVEIFLDDYVGVEDVPLLEFACVFKVVLEIFIQ